MSDKKGIILLIILLISFGAGIVYLSIKGPARDAVKIKTADPSVKAKDKVELLIEARKNAASEKEGETQDSGVSKGTHRIVTDLEIEIAILDRLIENNPTDANAHKKRLDLYNSEHSRYLNPDPNDEFLNKALKDVDNAIKSDETDSIDLLKLRAEIQRCLGHYSDSASDLSYVISIAKPDADSVALTTLYESRGECYEKMEKPEEAIKDYSEAIKLLPSIPDDYLARGRCYELLGQYEEAIADYNSAVTLGRENEDLTVVLRQRGMSYYKAKKYEAAIIDFDKLLRLHPEDSGYYFYKALSLDNMGKSDEALKFYKECLDHKTTSFIFDRSQAQTRIDELEKGSSGGKSPM